uniref:Insulinoma-associated protein 1b n=1 Tax=Phallusia mammillata TaxID=59560 RepID=A0A6F9DF71_9ASCI|nr:insulinoma-associated protein 1b [Phallusia mammillata]
MCRLCAKIHSNALELAQHRCPRIVNVRYECSECGKNFGCPANLASHKRWHKPKASCSDTMANPEGKRRKLSVSPVPAFNDIPHAVPARENLQAANRPSPLAIVSQEERSIPSPNVRLKAIFPCPGCKRRFRRESNRRKHALVKHDIVIPYEPTTKQEKKVASPVPKEVVSSLEREQTMPAPPMRCNLTTLALAAEAINGASLTRPHGPTTPNSGGTQPLDLTNKSTTPLSHGVDQILNLSKTKSFVPSQFPAVNNVVSAHLKHRLLQGNIGFIQGATGRGEQQLQTNHFQQWPHYHAQHLFTDYRYLAAIAADRMLACQYRM